MKLLYNGKHGDATGIQIQIIDDEPRKKQMF